MVSFVVFERHQDFFLSVSCVAYIRVIHSEARAWRQLFLGSLPKNLSSYLALLIS
jgi:hypothetical protein